MKKNEFRINQIIKALKNKLIDSGFLNKSDDDLIDFQKVYKLIYFYTEKKEIPNDNMFKEDAVFMNINNGILLLYYYRNNIKADGTFGSFILNDMIGFSDLNHFYSWCKDNNESKIYEAVKKQYITENFEKMNALISKSKNKSKLTKI